MGIAFTRATVGGVITSAMHNQLIDAWDNPVCRVTTSTVQTTSSTAGTLTVIQFDTEAFDVYGMHSTTTNNSRITIPTGWGGYYLAFGRARINVGSAQLVTQFAVNGNQVGSSADRSIGFGPSAQGAFGKVFDILQLNANDYVELQVLSDTASQTLVAGNCFLSLGFIHQ